MDTKRANRIAVSLEHLVLAGHFRHGDRLDETSLANQFGVSRTPIREALRKLAETDLAVQVPRRGTFVRQPDAIALIEMFETAAEIEAICTRFAAQRMTADALNLLRDVNELCAQRAKADDPDGYARHNEEFHRMLFRLSGNAFLEAKSLQLFLRMRPFRRVQFLSVGRMESSVREHWTLLDALSQGNIRAASEAARIHVASQGDVFYGHMARLRQRAPTFEQCQSLARPA